MSIKRGRVTESDVYYNHAKDAALSGVERPDSITRRDGNKQKARRHHILEKDLILKTEEMKLKERWIGPCNKWKTYWAIIESLYQLGPNQQHLFGAVFIKIEELMDDEASRDSSERTAWQRFADKDSRNNTSGKDALGRIWDSIKVLQRLGGANPYGLKLAQLGACINIYGKKDKPYIELRIGIPAGSDITPINEIRSRDYPRSITSVPSGYKAEGGLHVIDLTEIGDPCSPSIQPLTIAQAAEKLEQSPNS